MVNEIALEDPRVNNMLSKAVLFAIFGNWRMETSRYEHLTWENRQFLHAKDLNTF